MSNDTRSQDRARLIRTLLGRHAPLRGFGQHDFYNLKDWLSDKRSQRPSGYMRMAPIRAAYKGHYLRWHLPEAFWVLEQAHKMKILDPQALADRPWADIGCGPGATASLAATIFLKSFNLEPKEITLIDISREATVEAAEIIRDISPNTNIQILDRDLRQPKEIKSLNLKNNSFVLISHLLNEWGQGPRFRPRKLGFLNSVVPDGSLVLVIEPPLREPTLDLMWLRDQCSDQVVLPCPTGTEDCPLARVRGGWCYVQVPRVWAEAQGLAPDDVGLRRRAGIKLETQSFAYLLLDQTKEMKNQGTHKVQLSGQRTALWMCTGDKVVRPRGQRSPAHRGALLGSHFRAAEDLESIQPKPEPNKQKTFSAHPRGTSQNHRKNRNSGKRD